MTNFYRRKLFDAAAALLAEDDLGMRLTHVAGHLLQIGDDDVPPGRLAAFDRLRDPLIAAPIAAQGRMLPRDLEAVDARRAAQGMLDLLVAETRED